MKRCLLKKILLILLVISGSSLPQVMKSSFYRSTDFKTGFCYQSWSTEKYDQKITEMVIPFSLIIPVSKKVTFSITTNTASASLNTASTDLKGLTDTRIFGSLVTMNDKLLITAGVFLPTGKTKLEKDQGAVASALALYPLYFRIPSFGQGLMANVGAVMAFETKRFIFGGGIGFIYKNGFQPFSNSDAVYKPGMELSVNVGGETNGNRNLKITLDVTYTLYGKDSYDNSEVFKSGNKLIVDLRTLFKFKGMDLLLYARERTKGRNDRGVGTLMTEEKNSNGNQLDFGSLVYFPFSDNVGMKLLADLKFYSKNEYENNGALIYGGGAGFNFLISNHLNFDVLAKYSKGTLNNQNLSLGITGIEFGGNIKYSL
jgi:hypothetical protein